MLQLSWAYFVLPDDSIQDDTDCMLNKTYYVQLIRDVLDKVFNYLVRREIYQIPDTDVRTVRHTDN